MKNILLIILTFITLVSCENIKENEYKISASVIGEDLDGKQVFLKKIGANNQPESIDSITISDKKFSFNGLAEVPELHYIFIEEVQNRRSYKCYSL